MFIGSVTGTGNKVSDTPFAKKSLGQHWLYDKESLQAMCDAAELQPNDVVLEIGPGLGTLTSFLVIQAKHVIAVEFDNLLATRLPERVKANNLEVIQQDILSVDFTELPADYKVVANIPYYLTSNLIRVLSETPNAPKIAVLLIQKEVAERVIAQPGQMSLLSVSAQFYWEAELDLKLPAALFTPPPKVDSQILKLTRRKSLLFPEIDQKDFFRIVKAGYAQRRKTLSNSLSSGLHLPREQVLSICETANIDPKRRAQTLSLNDWHSLYLASKA